MVNFCCHHRWRFRHSNIMVFFVIYVGGGARGCLLLAARSCGDVFNFFDASKNIYAAVDGIYIRGKLCLVGCQYFECLEHVLHESGLIRGGCSHGLVCETIL